MVFVDTVESQTPPPDRNTLKKLALVASVAAGVQFGWALQLSLLTPYTQLLGLKHKWVSLIWLCGPISGLIVQPILGHHSDRCTSPFGRRRPFLVAGTFLLSFGVLLIGFAADLGRSLGDSLEPGVKHGAITVFVLGFWFLDISNNMIQGPCRALLADLSCQNAALVTIGNAMFAFFMAVGSILGYAAGAYGEIHRLLPFTSTEACDLNCANIKTCFLISVVLTTSIVTMVVVFVKEERLDPSCLLYWQENQGAEEKPPSFLMQIVLAAKSTSRPIWILYVVTALNWIGIFPFTLYDTDWVGKEIYGGQAMGSPVQIKLYHDGVRAGAFGLMFYVATMGAVSLFLELLIRLLGNVNRLWSACNFILAICMGMTVLVSNMAENARHANGNAPVHPPTEVKASCFAIFAVLGIPQAVTYSIPFALASIYSKDTTTGQGLALGLLNLAIVIPQMLVALISGPLDALFGSSNLPAFVWGGIAAAIGGIAAFKLPPAESENMAS
ncbi:Sucrose transport protein SUC2 [Sesamum alatum]|uniref:Sucrose transport protein SUC2 n=1 Tax=Sesamum alatum TaxID=300844 RepID=A0AAE2C8T0_9LAMI|nr:Sucrose transport protein SUC2 [Sesamum alatum]